MDYRDFKIQYQNLPFIFSRDAASATANSQMMRNQLTRWTKRGLLVSLRKGIYILNAADRKIHPDSFSVANILYEPSYVSLESALSFYELIPEKVTTVTSVTTKKTARFENEFGAFAYQRIKPAAFRGFKKIGEGYQSFFMAEPEKAVVDFLYLNLSVFDRNAKDRLENSYRFQNIEQLSPVRLKELAELLSSKKLMKIIDILTRWIKEESHD